MNRRDFLKCVSSSAIAANASGSFAEEDRPVVHTAAGAVRGEVRDGIAVFLGIPYGADTRKTRFQPPLPSAAWNGVRDALSWGDRAPQLSGRGMTSRAGQHTQV